MNQFINKFNALVSAQKRVNSLTSDLNSMVEQHLGSDWFVTYDHGDGILLVSPQAHNYQIQVYLKCLNKPRDQAIAYIEERPFN